MTNAMPVSDTITITFPDGNTRDYASGTTGFEVAESISKSLSKAAIAITLNGVQKDLCDPLNTNGTVSIITLKDEAGLEIMRHTLTAQVLARAVKNIYPSAKLAIGPTIENGFYYDIAFERAISSDDLGTIEKEMRRLLGAGNAITKKIVPKSKAIKLFTDRNEPYKVQIIEGAEDSQFQIYCQGDTDFIDLCYGPHLPSLKKIGAFKLMKLAGAYWRGDSNNEMLTRIYGTAWRDEKELKAHLTQIEEAEKRDHRKLGKEMDLFHLQEEAQGSVFWHAKGYAIYLQLEAYIRRRLKDAGYDEVKTPQLMDQRLWEASGHWEKFGENMFVTPDIVPNTTGKGPVFTEEPKNFMALKPMNCPAHVQIFKQGVTSYKDLPIRLAEFGCCHRNEPHGALHGIMRVRQMTQDDAHIFCREDQITQESVAFCALLQKIYTDLGFEDLNVRLALRPEKRGGTEETWDKAENGLREALTQAGLSFEEDEGEGAFYGPKIEFHIKDAIGRSWQCGTLQLDFILPERLDASYIGEDGEKHRPVMLHRAILGTFERFIGMMIESYAGKFPLWLAPTHCVITTITSSADSYAQELYQTMWNAGLRVELDTRNEKINYKIREHSHKKVPNIFVVGAREAEEKTVAIRRLGGKDKDIMSAEKAITELIEQSRPPY